MRIRKLHISGFKSFAEPLTIEFRKQLIGIVGPNGCGKSNLFEAVRWVMGESSSKSLRGESGTDVICNGSSDRKAAGRAEVELVFDNSDGQISGKAGSWQEISVRRTIDREAESCYYLNGSRCRRRDISSLFSGTGFGPRSYSMIEQGMIGRIIESKPEALRAHLEEAAGISLYRSSKRETETRMRSTKSNLEQVVLVVDEVERQMRSLRRQAQQAKRYQELVAKESELQSQVLALTWQEHEQRLVQLRQQGSALTTDMERERGELQALTADTERLRLELQGREQKSDELRQAFHEIGAAVSVQEKDCQHGREQRDGLQLEQRKLAEKMQQEQRQFEQDDLQVRQLEQEKAQLEASSLKLKQELADSDKLCAAIEEEFNQRQQRLEATRNTAAEQQRRKVGDGAKLESLQRLLQQSGKRHEEMEAEIKLSKDSADGDELTSQRQLLQQLQQQCEQAKASIQRHVQGLRDLRDNATAVDDQLAAKREGLRHLHGELASLQALQNEALRKGPDGNPLDDSGLDQAPRLGERLQATGQWHLAVEVALNKHLQDLELDEPKDLLNLGNDGGALGAYRAGLPNAGTEPQAPHPGLASLAAQISSPGLPTEFLAGVWAAPDLDTALAARANLAEGHSVITTDGVWLGKDWIRIGLPQEAGTLNRAAELKGIGASYRQAQEECAELERELSGKRDAQHQAELELQEAREGLQALQDRLAQQQGEVAVGEFRAADRQERIRSLLQSITENSEQQNQLRREIDQVQDALRQTDDKIKSAMQQVAECQSDHEQSRQALEGNRAKRDAARDRLHQSELRHEAINSRLESLQESMQRQEQNHHQDQSRAVELSAELDRSNQLISEQQQKLQSLLAERNASEQHLQKRQAELQQDRDAIDARENQQKALVSGLRERESGLQENELKITELMTKQQMLHEQVESGGHDPQQLRQPIATDASLRQLREELAQLQQKISAHSQVNLAAVTEQEELEKRKQYLDQQRQDLEKAMETLKKSIRQIDAESKKRFMATFEQVNENLQTMFTRLFGGGYAKLELLDPDAGADSGVIIRARPPGKRGSLISMLSGGEKTLVALALIFATFMLNPSPVCFLDEVDAPLDDVNIGRFTSMVRAMGEQVQFMFITHNKLSMEMADVLFGITMREAGVSRLVSVDVQDAVNMVEEPA